MDLLKKGKYTGSCGFSKVNKANLTAYEKNNLHALRGYVINGQRYLIKGINNFINRYALVSAGKVDRNKYEVLANSGSIQFLETYLITSTAVFIHSSK